MSGAGTLVLQGGRGFQEDLLDGLDAAQREGVLAGGGLVVMPSGAGTGKTRVLTTRIAHLVTARSQEPGRILAVTFTNKAAREMRERAVALGGPEIAGARIQTLHALSAALVRTHFAAAGLSARDWGIASGPERTDVMRQAMIACGMLGPDGADDDGAALAERRAAIDECERRIDRWKENGLTAEMIRHPGRPRRGAADEDAAKVYLSYDADLRARNLVDFADLVILSCRVLETHPDILAREAGRIDWLLVDEAQDLNPVQMRLVRLLGSVCGNLLLVGDDDQGLYSFRGSIPRLMDRAADLLPEFATRGLTVVRLVTNRRCTDAVLKPANMLVDYNPRDEPKVLRAGRDGPAVTASGYPTDTAEAEAVVARAAALIHSGVSPDRIAVLGRSKFPMQTVERAFVKAGVRHSMQAGNGLIERSEVQDALAYLRLATDSNAGLAFTRIAARPTRGLGAAAVAAVLSMGGHVPIYDRLATCAEAGAFKSRANAEAARFAQHLSTLSRAARNGEPSEAILRYVFEDIGYRDWAVAARDAPRTLRSSMDALLDIARDKLDFTTFMRDICLLSDPEERAADGVHIGTLHGAKGLEWDYVFIVAVEEGILPHKRALQDGEKLSDPDDPWDTASAGGLEEERRLAHVGLTRARLEAHVSFAMQRGLGPMRRSSKPSRFLREAGLPVPKVRASFAQAKAARGGGAVRKRTSFL